MSKKTSKEKKELVQEQKLLDVDEKLILEHPAYKEIAEKLLSEERKSDEYKNSWMSTHADLENLKRRTERDVAYAHKYALEKFAKELLITVDNLERSLKAKPDGSKELEDFYVGIELTLRSLLEVLERFGITVIDPLGEKFDHEKHTAISTKEGDELEPGVILEVIQKGYWLKDRLLRPALVVVTK